MNNYNTIVNALTAFMEDMWLPYEDSRSTLDREMDQDGSLKRKLTNEFIKAINDVNFDWINLARESQLLIIPEAYTNVEIKNYLKLLLHDYLIPDKTITKERLDDLNITVENLLQKHTSNDGWVLAYDLFDELKKQDKFINLEYYNLWKLPFIKRRILQRSIENKDREIGYLKYNPL